MPNSDLVVWNLRATDAGIYQCRGRNDAGEIQAAALLTVKVSRKMIYNRQMCRHRGAFHKDNYTMLLIIII